MLKTKESAIGRISALMPAYIDLHDMESVLESHTLVLR